MYNTPDYLSNKYIKLLNLFISLSTKTVGLPLTDHPKIIF